MTFSSIVSRASAVLDLVCASNAPLSFSNVVKQSGLPKSSAHRILSILVEERLVAFDGVRQTYQPGGRMLAWATGALRVNDLPDLCAGAMEHLNVVTGAHVALSILDGSSVLYLKTVDPVEPYRLAPKVGERSPLHVSAAGKVLLANLPLQKRQLIQDDLVLERFTEHTISDARAFEAELENTRATGYAVCDREEFLQISGIAAPIIGHQGEMFGAISVWNTVDRQSAEALLGFGPELASATSDLSARLGG